MKDINKGDLLQLIDSLPATIKKDRQKIAQALLPQIQNYMDASSRITYITKDERLYLTIEVKRTGKYQHELRQKNRTG